MRARVGQRGAGGLQRRRELWVIDGISLARVPDMTRTTQHSSLSIGRSGWRSLLSHNRQAPTPCKPMKNQIEGLSFLPYRR
jgi:hypothetical protein